MVDEGGSHLGGKWLSRADSNCKHSFRGEPTLLADESDGGCNREKTTKDDPHVCDLSGWVKLGIVIC